MKKSLLLTLLATASVILYGQTTAVPDPIFEQRLIDLGIDTNGLNGNILNADAATVTELFLNFQDINDITGIEAFINLTSLQCQSNNLTSIDISANTQLTFINVGNNDLTSINTTANTALTTLSVWGNDLNSLEVSHLPDLVTISCGSNGNLTSLDITSNPLLESLRSTFTNISSIDITQNPNLIDLYLRGNNLTTIDMSNNPILDVVDLGVNNMTSIDVSQNPILTTLALSDITTLDISANTQLEYLFLSGTNLTTLDLSNQPELIFLDVAFSDLTSLDLSNQPLLEELSCRQTNLQELDLSNQTALVGLNCSFNDLTSLNVQNGNNTIISNFEAINNPNLACIQVDDVAYSTANWTDIDPQTSFSEDCTLSVNSLDLGSSMSMYPNPASNYVTIGSSSNDIITKIELYTLQGKKVKLRLSPNAPIDISDVAKGVYLVKVQTQNEITTKKLIIQ